MNDWVPTARLEWRREGADPLVADARLLALLAAIAATGSLQRAARGTGLSYRHAWSLLQPWTAPAPRPLVSLRRGQGAALTADGQALLRLDRDGRELLQDLAPRFALLAGSGGAMSSQRHGCEASHDLALAALPECARDHGLNLDLAFRGSADAVAALAAGRCALAGFHVPTGHSDPLRRAVLAPLLVLGGDVDVAVVVLLYRTQGLIVPRRNPRHLTTLVDLTRRGVRFVNRQRGAGTRLLFDTLLGGAGIAPRAIAGYDNEEFTHAAVAATVAAGAAHAGFGIAAAAAQFRLGFVPLAEEVYALALRRDAFAAPAEASLLATLRGRAWREAVAGKPGYRAPARVSVQSLDRFMR